ncbi:TIGR02646 family protein [Vibrio lentus]|uniref:retron Ec78 anti-phage system effector HNH endonuclease PtuB n=1 Tax=Vibrio lentus TaxID=136468 RepID=UPI000C84574D|nr:retron Ec78 anti-phage system effector HNH endonuclease PtuB [Vibrio lentus]PMH31900.1 TIGR02646 family protein [Vibrio lentus]PMK63712.1 TIGR02646 family protein [Vibrio lentus]
MRELDRSLANKPACLKKFDDSKHTWDDVKSRNKRAIWNQINKFQYGLCVYCESKATQGVSSGHIEHFYHKGSSEYKHLTFEWDNLFGCCASNLHCGHYKDYKVNGITNYDPKKLIKPDKLNPSIYFQFSQNGKVTYKSGLAAVELVKAKETLRALNLNAPDLVLSRFNQIKLYSNRLRALEQFVEEHQLGEKEFKKEYQAIWDDAKNDTHLSSVCQTLF